MKFKKVLLFVFSVVLAFSFTACNKQVDLATYLSQQRVNIYKGESDNYKITAYVEDREFPLNNDGYAQTTQPCVIFKLDFKLEKQDGLKVEFSSVGKSYSSDFSYDPVTALETAVVKTPTLIDGEELLVKITSTTLEEQINLISCKQNSTLSVGEILESLSSSIKDDINKIFSQDKSVEINVRLLEDDGKNYYYVGFSVESGGTTAYLVDGETGKVLATKTF